MLNRQLKVLLNKLKLQGVVDSLSTNIDLVYSNEINFEKALIDACNAELYIRNCRSLGRLIKSANLRYPHARIEDVNFEVNRSGLSKQSIHRFSECTWIHNRKNLFLIGSTGIGKTWLACALATKACSKGCKTKFFKYFEFITLFENLVDKTIDNRLIKKLMKFDLLIIDDFGLISLPPAVEVILLDFIDKFSMQGSLLITSQFSCDVWYERFNNSAIADEILDRLTHNSYTIEISGDSMRKIGSSDEKATL